MTCRFQSAGNGYHCKMRFGMTPPCWTTTPFKPPVAISSTKSSNARMVVKKQTQKRRKNKSASSPSRFISGSVSTYLFSLTDCVGRHREPQTREIVLGDIGRQLLLRYWGGPQNMRITDFQKIICYWSTVNCTGLNAFLCQLI